MRRSVGTVALVACALAGACFDGEELLDGEPCRFNEDCAGNQVCRDGGLDDFGYALGLRCLEPLDPCAVTADGGSGESGECMDSNSTPVTMSTTSASSSTTDASTTAGTSTSTTTAEGPPCAGQGSSCAAGESCCEGTTCVYYAEGDNRCESTCSYGGECSSCCCVQLQDMVTSACVDASYCGTDVSCSSGCAISGSQCSTDDDCCDASPYGSVCIQNSGMWYSCFKLCSVGTDCSTGCCNYNSVISQYICETC